MSQLGSASKAEIEKDTSSDVALKQYTSSDVGLKQNTSELELKIAKLKHQKTISKSALTKSKNKLLNLVELETPDRKTIRSLIDQVSFLQSKAIGLIVELLEAYNWVGDLEKVQKTSKEIETVEEEIELALDKAEAFLKNRSHFSSDAKSIQSEMLRSRQVDANRSQDSCKGLLHDADLDSDGTGQVSNQGYKHASYNLGHFQQRSNMDMKRTPVPDNTKGCYTTSGKSSRQHNLGEDMWKQLKRVSIPVFSGDVREYEGWKSAFMACVDKAPATNEYKLLQLKQYLSGEAAHIVARLGHSASVYDVALERLDRKYGGKRRQVALQLEEIYNFKPIRLGNAKDMDKFADMLDVAVVSLRESDKIEELGSGCLYSLLVKKMNEPMITQFHRWLFEHQRQESVETLREWILQEAEFQTIASEVKHGIADRSKTTDKRDSYKKGTYATTHNKTRARKCHVCHEADHDTSDCIEFKSIDLPKRWERAKELGLCFRCLDTGHLGRSCSRVLKCGIDGCKANHNRLLHDQTKVTSSSRADSGNVEMKHTTTRTPQAGRSETITMATSKQEGHYLALRTVPVILKNGQHRMMVNALLDDASTHTYINEDVAAELGVQGQTQQVSVNVLNDKQEIFDSMLIDIGLESTDGSVDMNITALTTTKVTGRMEVIDWRKHAKEWPHLTKINFPKVSSRPRVDILLGMDYLELHSSLKEVRGAQGEPVARLTPLGWTCVGAVSGSDKTHIAGSDKTQIAGSFFIRNTEIEATTDIESLIHSFWESESISGLTSIRSIDENDAVNAVEQSLVYKADRYQVGIPWKEGHENLKNNYDMAYNRLLNLEKKLSKDQTISGAYNEVIEQYLKKGYIRKVPETEIDQSKWYLPHFPVIKPDRSTTKVRIVFDASAKNKGISLNDVIHQGPKLQNDLFEILLRFRKHPVAIICDIAEMYLQIEVAQDDRPYLRFLWRSMDWNKKPDVFEFSKVVFGLNCSPFLAQFITQEHAKSMEKELPLAAATVEKSTYMDDNMDSVDTNSKAIELYKQLQQLWSTAGMHARKWVSNSVQVLQEIPEEDRLKEINIQMSELPSVKALGLLWNAESDEFRFSFMSLKQDIKMTKRNFLKETAKLFDPLGFLGPFIIRARVLLQEMWISGVNWDETLSPDLEQKAWSWYLEIEKLCSVKIPRGLEVSLDTSKMKLHTFVDASEAAFGAVVYLVTTREDDTKSSYLVASKCHVAPLKAVSMPRLELLAAVLGVRLLLAITKALELPLQCATLWSDSQNVLWWIKRQSRCFKPFVANRIGYIQEHTNTNQWKYVPSRLNAADILSRGVDVEALMTEKWLNGPEFMTHDETEWPKQTIDMDNTETSELKKPSSQVNIAMFTKSDPISWRLASARFSSWKRLCRVLAWIYRFLNNARVPYSLRKKGELDPEEIEDAETTIMARTQREEFSDDYSSLMRKLNLPSNSKLFGLQPYVDKNGLMRTGGRLRFADVLSFSARFPIILPRHSWVTKLIVKFYHEQVNHTGTNSTLSAVSSRFWIISAREEIRQWEKECSWCRRQKAKPAHQIMADLPKIRVRCTMKAFVTTGVDYAGPFFTVQGRGKSRQKRYLCLFTCLSTRAVHLEMAFGLDTDSFLNALFRMAHRRGMPKEVISDNGTNFVGAAKELKQLISGLNSDVVKSTLANKSVKWLFNPPHAPYFGGVFESLVKSAKRAIYAILSSGDVSDEELMTAFTGAEALLNSRPLTYQSAHPQDDVPLTPNHFLHGQVGGDFAPELDSTSFSPKKRWRRVQELLRHVWKRWMREWLPTLNIRKKWFTPSRDIQVDDVVIVVSPDTPRGVWPLGRVIKTYPGKDDHVRVLDVQVGKTVLKRPITKVCPLEWS